jgi:uncharacterized protein YndB with AHSA1/START domain
MQAMPTVGRTIEKEVFIAAAPERVFRAFTTKEDLEHWFVTRAEIDARVGGTYQLWWTQDTTHGEFLEFDPPRRLSFTWDEGPKLAPTTSTIEFIPEADGTLVRLTHTGFGESGDWDELYNGVNSGWTEELGNLKIWLETGVEKTRA